MAYSPTDTLATTVSIASGLSASHTSPPVARVNLMYLLTRLEGQWAHTATSTQR